MLAKQYYSEIISGGLFPRPGLMSPQKEENLQENGNINIKCHVFWGVIQR